MAALTPAPGGQLRDFDVKPANERGCVGPRWNARAKGSVYSSTHWRRSMLPSEWTPDGADEEAHVPRERRPAMASGGNAPGFHPA